MSCDNCSSYSQGTCDSKFVKAFDDCRTLPCCRYITVSYGTLVAFFILVALGIFVWLLYLCCIRRTFYTKITKPQDAEEKGPSAEMTGAMAAHFEHVPSKSDILLSTHMKNVMNAKGVPWPIGPPKPNEYAWQTFDWSTIQNVPGTGSIRAMNLSDKMTSQPSAATKAMSTKPSTPSTPGSEKSNAQKVSMSTRK